MTPDSTEQETIALVSCVKKKRSGPCMAKDLYVSPLFRFMRTYAEHKADRWFILSAKYGLVRPTDVLESYEQTLNESSVKQRRKWAAHVLQQMRDEDLLRPGVTFLWLAGQAYQKYLSSLLAGLSQLDPLAGKRFGERLAWLKKRTQAR